MDKKEYMKIKEQFLKSCESSIVRIYDEAFTNHWNSYMKGLKGQLLAESFAFPLIASWMLWYIFEEKEPITGILGVSILAIMLCAFAHYVCSMRHHRNWAHSEFTGYGSEQAAARCLLECKAIMEANAKTEEERKEISVFFDIATPDGDVGSSMYRVWVQNSKKTHFHAD